MPTPDRAALAHRASLPLGRPLRRPWMYLKIAILLAGTGGFGNVQAQFPDNKIEQRQFLWRNSSFETYTMARTRYSGCVTNPGPATFDVRRGPLVGVQITVGGNCLAFIDWRYAQHRTTGDIDAFIRYTEIYDTEGLTAFVSVAFNKPAGARGVDYFQVQCGPALGTSPSCLGRSALLPSPTSGSLIAFNALAISVPLMFTGPYWQPMRR